MRFEKLKLNELFPIIFAILFFASPTPAQTQPSKLQLFGGYSYANSSQGGLQEHRNSNGWGVDLSGSLYKHLGFTADIAGQYGRAYSGQTAFRAHDFLLGGSLNWSAGKLDGFVHVLAGVAHVNAYDLPYKYFYLHYPAETRFAMAFGGGLDIAVCKHVAIRAAKFDYIPARTRPYWTQNIRVQTGIVWRFGP